MIKKKICIMGAFAVGKTSLVERFVKSIFTNKYLATIGVKIEQKDIEIADKLVRLIIWDINGEDDHQNVKTAYLKGMAGYFLVADGTRKETLEIAEDLQNRALTATGNEVFTLLINKSDLTQTWEIDDNLINEFKAKGWNVIITSAKSGENVEEAFIDLTNRILEN